MQEFKTKIGEDGRIVIPASFRRQLHLKPGEELIIRLNNDTISLISVKYALKKLQAMVADHVQKGDSLVEELKRMRQDEVIDKKENIEKISQNRLSKKVARKNNEK